MAPTILDKIIAAIHALKNPKGSSRSAIAKYLASEYQLENSAAFKKSLKRGVDDGILTQTGQSFRVVGSVLHEVEKPTVEQHDIKVGTGPLAERGDTITVAYVGTLDDGYSFDKASSFTFQLGVGDVIKGWDEGCVGMQTGGKRKLVVPSELGYGKRGCKPDIQPNATLHFVVTMKTIRK
jgi:hypothetical protein